jgi:hypothetical protein
MGIVRSFFIEMRVRWWHLASACKESKEKFTAYGWHKSSFLPIKFWVKAFF